MTTSPRADGPIAAMAGRSIPGSVLSTILASASSAPVLPAETTPAASPAATASMASRIEAARMRSAAVGLSRCRSRPARGARCRRRRRGAAASAAAPRRASSPISRKRAAGMAFGGDFQPVEDHLGRVVAAHGVDRQGEAFADGVATGCSPVERSPPRYARTSPPAVGAQARTAPFSALAGGDHFAAVIEAAMAADVMRALQFAAVRALRVRFGRQRLVAAAHAPPGRRGLSLRYCHGSAPFRCW